MRYVKVLLLLAIGFVFLTGCSESPVDATDDGSGRIVVEAFDAPIPGEVESVNIFISKISLHKSAEMAEADSEWIKIAEPNKWINFLDLVNGLKETVVDTALGSGHYTQLRLVVTDDSYVVLKDDPDQHLLKIPSGPQVGIKLNMDFTVSDQELITLYLDFNAQKSLKLNPGIDRFIMEPTFRAFKQVVSGTIQGIVQDTAGAAVKNASIVALANVDTLAGTVSDEDGNFLLVVEEGAYSIAAEAEGYSEVDTTYEDVQVSAEQELTGFDFTLTPAEETTDDGSGTQGN